MPNSEVILSDEYRRITPQEFLVLWENEQSNVHSPLRFNAMYIAMRQDLIETRLSEIERWMRQENNDKSSKVEKENSNGDT